MTDCPTVRSEWSTPSTMVGMGAAGTEAAAACDGGCDRRGRLRGRDEERGGGREARSTPAMWQSSRLRPVSPCAATLSSASVLDCVMRTW
eukprot:6490202-Prymnesium_polylepis.1